MRKYKLNENFFDKWSNDVAYVLGWVYTDGNIAKGRPRLKIASCDREVLVLIRKMMGSGNTIFSRLPKNRTRTQFTLIIDSKKIYNRLLQIGLVPRKSKIITMPKVPKRFLTSFVRGVIEGNGSIYLQKQSYKNKKYNFLRLSIVSGSKVFLDVLQLQIHRHFSVQTKVISKNKTAFQIKYSIKEADKILTEIYKNSKERRLNRKYLIFKKWRKNYANSQRVKIEKFPISQRHHNRF